MPFPRVLALGEMQTVSSKIWTQVGESIFLRRVHFPAPLTLLSLSLSLSLSLYIIYIYMYVERERERERERDCYVKPKRLIEVRCF